MRLENAIYMKYIAGDAYFCKVEDRIKQYPYLNQNIKSDILIIGGGIDGAILNFYLSQKYNVALVDASRLGMCATSAATALLEYQLDDYAQDLKEYMSEDEIVLAYKIGLESIEQIDNFIKQFGNHCHFRKCPSLMFTNSFIGVKPLEEEHYFRLKNGFKSVLYDKENNPFPFDLKLGLYNEDGGAELNPYLFARQMIENSKNQNLIFENTKIIEIEEKDGDIIAKTEFGTMIN